MVDDSNAKTRAVKVLGHRMEIAALLVEEVLAVGDEELEVADLRLVDSGKINPVEHAGGSREPQAAGRRVCRAHGVLGAASPSRRDAGSASGDGRCEDSCHRWASVRFDP